jgi:hypothetical protein
MQNKLSLDLDIRVLESSRPTSAGARKLSYHVIGTNLAFEDCSKNGPLDAFVMDFLDTNAKDKAFFWPDNLNRSIVDKSVYSRNRVLRTPLSFKLDDETKTPLLLLQPWNGQNEIEEAFVTNLTVCGPGLRILTMQDISSIIPAKATKNMSFICFPQLGGMKKEEGASASSAGRGRSISSHAAQAGGPSVCPTVSVKELQVMLDAAGSEGCVVLGQLPDPSKKDGTTNFECRNVGKRKCLVCEGEMHEKNNASLNVDRATNVRYWCFAPDCHKRGPVHIGSLVQGLGGALPSAYASGSVATPFRAKLDLDAAPNVAVEAGHGATSKMEVDHKATTAEEEADHEAPSAMEIDYEAASSLKAEESGDGNDEAQQQQLSPPFANQDVSSPASQKPRASSNPCKEPAPRHNYLEAVIREFALMGPIANRDDMYNILSWAAEAAGGLQSEKGMAALRAAALEWSYRCLDACKLAEYAESQGPVSASQQPDEESEETGSTSQHEDEESEETGSTSQHEDEEREETGSTSQHED